LLTAGESAMAQTNTVTTIKKNAIPTTVKVKVGSSYPEVPHAPGIPLESAM
jgi:hypothetical protein